MDSYKFVHVDEIYRDPKQTLRRLRSIEKMQLASTRFFGWVDREMQTRMRTLVNRDSRIIILNRFVPRGEVLTDLPREQLYPFCSLYKNGHGMSVLDTTEALKPGNYFLCIPLNEEPEPESDRPDPSEETDNGLFEYRCHIDPDKPFRFKTHYPAYVNMDRTADQIGGSSWDGNLVSWFRAGYTTRVQYGVQAGLLPDES